VSSDPAERALARLLDNPAVWAEVTPGLKERVLAEALGGEAAPADEPEHWDDNGDDNGNEPELDKPTDLRSLILAEATGPRHAAPTTARRQGPPVWQRPLLLAAAAALLVGVTIGGTLVATRDEAPPTGTEVALAGTENMPDASATVDLRNEPSGISVTLNVSGLPPAPDGTFYEAWLVSEELGKVSAGTFHIRGPQEDIQLWLGVDPANYDAFTVTRQPTQGGTLADGVVMLRGEIPPPD
jgi:hypothetical protein